MRTILLLFCSNVFMTLTWYGRLRYGRAWPTWKAVLVSWGIAFVEYCFTVPADCLGSAEVFSGFKLKLAQG